MYTEGKKRDVWSWLEMEHKKLQFLVPPKRDKKVQEREKKEVYHKI